MSHFFRRWKPSRVRCPLNFPREVNPSATSRHLCGSSENPEAASPWKSTEGLVRCSANHAPLTPITFLERAARVYRDATSVVYGSSKLTWSETHARCVKLASALAQLGISRNDVVATLAPNIPAMQELHFAVPMAGAIICPLNTRHDSATISALLHHSEAKIIFVDHHLLHTAQTSFNLLAGKNINPPLLVLISESSTTTPPPPSAHDYETLISSGDSEFLTKTPTTEFDPISINYTSGTTSQPKGVVYNHRGAYLNALATTSIHNMSSSPVYLWTVPMFHCNGWCLIWGLAALGGTNICLRNISPKLIFSSIATHKVTHMSGAPTVLNMIVNSTEKKPLDHTVEITTGGAPPPLPVLSKIEDLGFKVSHLYGLTETYGPGTSCVWRPEWDSLPNSERVKLKSRQGVEHYCLKGVDVKNSETMESVPSDGATIGEIMFRGNTVMSGYLKDRKATEEAFSGGWFRSGDIGVKHEDGYIEVKDRLKDVVISGGENVSSLEVEGVLEGHPAVMEAAVVGRADEYWGESVCAFVKVKEGMEVSSREVMEFCRERLPRYMAPKSVVFGDLPRTSTGKVQKFVLRERAKAMGSLK